MLELIHVRAGHPVRATADGSIALEALYEVTGFDRVSLDAVLVYTGTLDYQNIWGGELP